MVFGGLKAALQKSIDECLKKKATGVIYNSIGNSRTHLKINRKRNGKVILLSRMHLILVKECSILLEMDLFLVLVHTEVVRESQFLIY